jgi:hypothetical protein
MPGGARIHKLLHQTPLLLLIILLLRLLLLLLLLLQPGSAGAAAPAAAAHKLGQAVPILDIFCSADEYIQHFRRARSRSQMPAADLQEVTVAQQLRVGVC